MEGNIADNTKSKTKKSTNGYTLVEMVVVMGIISVLFVIVPSALVSARNQAIVDQKAEEIIIAIREARNKAIYVEKIPGKESKGWAVFLETSNPNTQYNFEGDLHEVLPSGSKNSLSSVIKNINLGSEGIAIKITKDGNPVNYVVLAFSSPFGKHYSYYGNSKEYFCVNDFIDIETLSDPNPVCKWQKTLLPTEEWEMVNATNDVLLGNNFEIEISRYNAKTIIGINKNGDARIK